MDWVLSENILKMIETYVATFSHLLYPNTLTTSNVYLVFQSSSTYVKWSQLGDFLDIQVQVLYWRQKLIQLRRASFSRDSYLKGLMKGLASGEIRSNALLDWLYEMYFSLCRQLLRLWLGNSVGQMCVTLFAQCLFANRHFCRYVLGELSYSHWCGSCQNRPFDHLMFGYHQHLQ